MTWAYVLTFYVTSTLWQFIDDPGLKNDKRNMPVQLPLAHSGWLFKEESEEPDVKPFSAGPKEEDMEVDVPSVKGILCQLPCVPSSPEALTWPPRLLLTNFIPTQKYRHRTKTEPLLGVHMSLYISTLGLSFSILEEPHSSRISFLLLFIIGIASFLAEPR